MNNDDRRLETHEALWEKVSAAVLLCFLVMYLILAMLQYNGPYGESASTLLPAVSLSSHGSFRITPEDLETACALFPGHAERLRLYYDIYLPEALAGGRYPFYLGVYAPLCIPVLSVLRCLHLDATYAFAITNALLLFTALWVVYRFAKISAKQKLLAILLLGTSPIIRYINVQLYEVTLFSFVTIAMVFWFNRQRKRAALFLAIGGTMNPTIMAFGFFMILDYFLELFRESNWSPKAFFKRFAVDWEKTAGLAACFFPCFIPFVITRIGLGYWYIQTNMGLQEMDGLSERFFAYLLDLNLGLFPYFPVLIFLFAIVTVWGGVFRKRYDMLCTLFGALAVIGAFSIIYHINCGMTGMARYNAWFVPIIALATVYYTDIAFSGVKVRLLYSRLTALSVIWCVLIIGVTAYSSHSGSWIWWSPVAETVMEYAPGMYNPLPSTFNSRTNHLDGGYDISEPVIYANDENYVRKVLVPPGMLDRAVTELLVPAEDQEIFDKQCDKVNRTDKFYYLNFPVGTHIRKYIPYELGVVVGFGEIEQDAHKYFLHGISGSETGTEGNYAWTDGNTAELYVVIDSRPEEDLLLSLHVGGVYRGPQHMTARMGEKVLLDESISDVSTPVDIVIPAAYIEDRVIDITFEFPDAVSPQEMGESNDMRKLAFAIKSFSVSYAE